MCAATLPHNQWIVRYSQVAAYGHCALHSYNRSQFPLPSSITGVQEFTVGPVTAFAARTAAGDIVISFGIDEEEERSMLQRGGLTQLGSVSPKWSDKSINVKVHTPVAELARTFIESPALGELSSFLRAQPAGTVAFTGFSFACNVAELIGRELTCIFFGQPSIGTMMYESVRVIHLHRHSDLPIEKSISFYRHDDNIGILFTGKVRGIFYPDFDGESTGIIRRSINFDGKVHGYPQHIISTESKEDILGGHDAAKYHECICQMEALGDDQVENIPYENKYNACFQSATTLAQKISEKHLLSPKPFVERVFPIREPTEYFLAIMHGNKCIDDGISDGETKDVIRRAVPQDLTKPFMGLENISLMKKFIDHVVFLIERSMKKESLPFPSTVHNVRDLPESDIIAICTAIAITQDDHILNSILYLHVFDIRRKACAIMAHLRLIVDVCKIAINWKVECIWNPHFQFVTDLDKYLTSFSEWQDDIKYKLDDFKADKDFWEQLKLYSDDVRCRYYFFLSQEVLRTASNYQLPICVRNPLLFAESEIAMEALPAPPASSVEPKMRENPFIFTPKDLLKQETFWDDMKNYAHENSIDYRSIHMLRLLCRYMDKHNVDIFVYLPPSGK
ncbi:hypothetical protein GUITHDRAFT_146913 [Guillardia theta CCMP2712]|uniref:Uncharacterized protein n=1 Tax=Guillardia theta (strain CCMP2712) TaxID=905079 RepID=L1IFY2_GUITC|nr:hypothetical protein GUITHDRAFT_146913 [Guillardia theta CCMP2712]EKX34799.1 hypothetical protein GUITHDRAFT_146913 [Guillardia theta CCMP2712]|eukprot:XP_005821779.1 hypothetical protein GUITHDRAFT_146913 [Guillardia theta CCMP2712]